MASPDTQAAPNGAAPNGNGGEVAVRQRVELGAPQTDFDAMYRLAGNLSRAQLLPQALRGKPADVLVIMMYGQELRLSPIQSIQGIYVVNGKPQLAGQLWLAKVRQAGHRVKITHADGSCTTEITRGDTGEVHAETFTVDDAKRAGLMGKDTYKGYQKRMLMWRSVSDCATVICPEVALGFGVAEIAEDTAVRGGIDPTAGQGGGSPLAGVVGAAASATPEAVDAALAQTPAAQPEHPRGPVATPLTVVDEATAPSHDELADAYRQMDSEAADPAGDAERGADESDEEYQRRIWGDAFVPDSTETEQAEQDKPRGRGSRK